MTIDTIFLCFCEDSKHNNGKDKPYFMSDAFMKYMSSNASNKPAETAAAQPAAEKPASGSKDAPPYKDAPAH